jgi:hypothetical protein
MRSNGLRVACNREVPVGADMAFRADRLMPSAAEHWTLCVSTDRPAIRLNDVAPAPVGYVLDRDGVLGLIFPAAITTVRLQIASLEVGTSEWRFWVDDDRFDGDAPRTGG